MKIADFSVDRPVAISMLIIAVLIIGLFSLPRLPIDLYPDMEIPVSVISTSYSGASPAEVEKMITKPLEAIVATAGNVKEIQSISSTGNSLVIVQFNWGTDIDNANVGLREKLEMIRNYLPDDADSPQVIKIDINQTPILTYSITGTDNVVKLKKIAEDTIKPALERIDGVASVSVTGGKEREIKIELDKAKLEAYGLSTVQIMQAISSDNVTGTAGSVNKGSQETTIRVNGEYATVAQLENIQISLPGSREVVALRDIAQIKDDYKEDTSYSYVNGKRTIGLSVMKATGSNTIEVAHGLKKEVEQLNKTLPSGTKIETIVDTSKYIQDSVNTVVEHGVLGGLIGVIVLFLFLRNMRSTIIVGLVIPVSIIATFTLMYFGNQTINLLSLGGLALGLGSLIDFSVVVLESIYRYRQNGYGLIEATKLGTAEVGNAVVASAGAQVVVFLPIVFVEGLAGILFKPMALTVSFSHLAALFASLTLVPMLSSRLLKNVRLIGEDLPQGRTLNPLTLFGKAIHKLTIIYGHILGWALKHRVTVIGLTVVLLVLSIAATPLIGTEFIPSMDQGQMNISVEMPAGTKLEETGKVAADLEAVAQEKLKDNIDLISSTVGSGQLSFLGSTSGNKADLQIKLVPQDQRTITTDEAVEMMHKVVANIPGGNITISAAETSMGGGSPIDISIRGDDLDVLKELGDIMVENVKKVPGTRNVENSLKESSSEVQIVVNREEAARYGLSASQVLSAVRIAYDGQIVSRMRTGDDEVDIRLQTLGNTNNTEDTIKDLTIVSATGARVPLSVVAEIQTGEAPVEINRANQNREVNITADISGRDLGSINKEIQAKLNKFPLPEGYSIEFGGEAKDMAESFASLASALLLSVVLIFMVMAAQFESLFQPFVIMFSLPPTFIGVIFGLGLTGHPLSVPAFIGAIMLVGIVMNNGIVLVDYINTLRKQGTERDQAVLQAGPVRLRPILMTALTTVLAILPMAFGTGEGAEAQAPMAVVIAFGLTLSTLITLVLIPVVYTLFDDIGIKLKKKFINLKKRFFKSQPQNVTTDL
ncbi:efflux RND transporter permease subunit [Bacillota bacterium LX-D]|nr:efflux RND transporter permease subunit [Bacillota bacterium LX-D]